MRRREFTTLLGGAAAAWPVMARAQQGERMRRIGVLMYWTEDDAEGQARLAAFAQARKQLGWSDGRNMRLDTRWASAADIRRHAAELVALAPDVLVAATGTATTASLLEATRTVPIVFVTVIDPVGAGFVASLARPGGNATGFTNYEYGMSGKWLKGEKPADLPVQGPVKYELTINLGTAKALGLEVRASLLAIADEVIE